MVDQLTTEYKNFTITALGSQGEGIAETEQGPVYFPLVLPGEKIGAVVQGDRAVICKILEPSPDRIKPVCKYFSSCGGCSLQHMSHETYLNWKRDLIVQAFAARGLNVHPEPVWSVSDHSRRHNLRRRAVFSARRTKKGSLLGFRERKSHDIVDIQECLIASPKIVEALGSLKLLMSHLLTRKGVARVSVTDTHTGLDVFIEDAKSDIDIHKRQDIAAIAREAKLSRLMVNNEIFYMSETPVILVDDIAIEPVPGGFLQAVPEAEEMMRKIILEAVGRAKKIADLFCGIGTFALPLAKQAEILVVELEERALKNLQKAAHGTSNLKPVKIQQRDLFQDPLVAKELQGFDAVIFDPPRAGAFSQAEELAKTQIPVIIAVSCNPKTLARDARVLVDAGYMIDRLVPIDQFRYSAHIEAVCVFKLSKAV